MMEQLAITERWGWRFSNLVADVVNYQAAISSEEALNRNGLISHAIELDEQFAALLYGMPPHIRSGTVTIKRPAYTMYPWYCHIYPDFQI